MVTIGETSPESTQPATEEPTTQEPAIPGVTPTATPTPEPGITPTVAACVYDGGYVADVTVPDGTVFAPGESFTKTWSLKNTGTCTWEAGVQLALSGGDALGSAGVASMGGIAPGEVFEVSIGMVAPGAPGSYTSTWEFRRPDGTPFGGHVTAQIVVEAPQPIVTTEPPPDSPTLTPTPTKTQPPAADTTAPSINVTHDPLNPTILTDKITWNITASDNVGVVKIELWVRSPGTLVPVPVKTCNNSTTCTYLGGPYSSGTLRYYAVAYDAAGNKGQSSTVNVTITVAVP